MKTRNILTLSAVLICALASCGETPTTATTIQPTETPTTEESIEPTTSEELTTSETPTTTEEESTLSYNPDDYIQEDYMNPLEVAYGSGGALYLNEFADPTVVRGDDGKIWAFGTDRATACSDDGVHFEYKGTNIIDFPKWWKDVYPDETMTVYCWAPDCIKIQDKWIYYYSLATTKHSIGIGYAVSDHCGGPYKDMGKLFSSPEIGINNSIDSQVIIDDDGRVYMTVGSFYGNYLLELTEDGMGLEGGVEYQKRNKILIAGKDYKCDTTTYEGGYIVKKDGFYYYFGSAGSCCSGKDSTYRVHVGKANKITGPYIGSDKMPLTKSGSGKTYGDMCLWTPNSMGDIAVAPGHNSVLKDDLGRYFIYYHCYSYHDNFRTRHLFMDELFWNEQGYPTTRGRVASIDEEFPGPAFLL